MYVDGPIALEANPIIKSLSNGLESRVANSAVAKFGEEQRVGIIYNWSPEDLS